MRGHDNQNRGGPGFNRRDFLKGSGAAVAATAMATADRDGEAAQPKLKPNVVSAKATAMTLNVNGKDHSVTLEPRVTLLDVLRNDLNLTGTKDVDENGASGADTVLVDGKTVLAGSRLAIECQGKKITTIEAFSDGGKVDEIITTFVKHDATQCGFCTPGFVMATRAFLNKKPNATVEEIHKGLGGNLCRCGTYHCLTQAVLTLAKKGGA